MNKMRCLKNLIVPNCYKSCTVKKNYYCRYIDFFLKFLSKYFLTPSKKNLNSIAVIITTSIEDTS